MKIAVILTALLLTCSACAQEPTTSTEAFIPLSIDSVETHRAGETLVRIIKHNMEITPKLELERLSAPNLKLIEQLTITSLVASGEKLTFADSEGVFIESIKVADSAITLSFDFSYSGGGSSLILCTLPLTDANFGSLTCHKEAYR